MRSIPTDPTVKLSKKAKAISHNTIEGAKNKNCYILFKEKDSVSKAIQGGNNTVLDGRHLHVTKGNHVDRDFKTTIFVGNLPYDADEEEVREFFTKVGKVEYVRVIRDKFTFKSHGFCYVKFNDRDSVLKALKITEEFKGRQLHI